jgi:hypothetical protein
MQVKKGDHKISSKSCMETKVHVLGHQANLKETSKGKELAKLRLQVLEVGKQVMLVNPKRKL